MRRYCFLLCLVGGLIAAPLAAQNPGSSQADTLPKPRKKDILPPIYRFEVQADVSRFFNETFRLFGLARNTTDFETLPHTLGFKYFDKRGRLAGRLGLGFYYNHREGGSEAFRDRITTDSSSVLMRVGVERRFVLGSRVSWGFGFDLLGGQYQWKSVKDSGFDLLTETKKTRFVGGAPVVSVQWHLSPKMRLGAEMAYMIQIANERQTQTFRDNPQFNTAPLAFQQANVKWYGPGNIYFSILF